MQKTLQQIHEDVPADYYDKGVKDNFLQKIWHERRFSELKSFIRSPRGKILDVGCHSGLFTSKFSKDPSVAIYGIDISSEAIVLAKKRIKKGHFYVADAHKLPFENSFFDVIFCFEMLEHVEMPEKVISEIFRVLKKGGRGVILIPTDNKLFKTIWYLWNLYRPVWKHAHIQSFNEEKLTVLLRKRKFKIVKSKKFNFEMLLLIEFVK